MLSVRICFDPALSAKGEVPRFCASSGISDLFGGIGESGSKSYCFTGMYVRPLAVGFKGFV